MKNINRNTHPFSIVLAATLAVFVTALTLQPAAADTYYYDNDSSTAGFGTAGGTWAAPTPGPIPGWTTDGTGASVPGSVTTAISDLINFGNGATGLGAGTITLSGSLSSSNITFASGSGALTLSGGTSLTLSSTATITVDNSSNTIATALAGAGTGLTKAGPGKLTLSGANTVSGTVTVTGGELELNGGSFNLGAKAVNVAALATGTGQQAILSLVNGSITNSANDGTVGAGTNAVGVIKLNGGNYVKTAGNLSFSSGSGKTNYGAFLISAGYADIAGEFNSARDGTNAAALVSLSGGTLVSRAFGTVGREGFGVLDISGGTFLRPSTAASRYYMGRTAGQFAQLTIRGTGTMNYDDNAGLYFANSATPVLRGVVNLMTGGTLISRAGISWNANVGSVGHFNFNGGTLQASGSPATYWNGLWTACYVHSGGAIIDSQVYNITVPQPLLVPSGNGVTSISSGAGSGFLAPPVVKIEGGGGVGATAIAQIDSNGNITGILITNPGVDYTSAPTVTLVGGGGTASGWTAAIGANATTGGLTKLGAGTLTLSGANTYQGATKIGGGTLAISYLNYPNTSALTLSNNAALNADVSGGANSLATPSLTLGTNTTINISYGVLGGNPFIPAIDNASATGTTLTANGTNIVINISGTGFAPGQFPLIKYSGGSIGGNGFAAFKLGSVPGVPPTSQLVNNTNAGTIDLSIPTVNTLTWNGNVSASWDINTTTNWKDGALSPQPYTEFGTTTIYGDIVTFDDTLSNPAQTNINLTTNLHPSAVNVTASSTPYTFSGSGKLSGSSLLNVNGTASLTLSAANDHTGGSTLGGGTVLLGNNAALGAGTVTLGGSVLSSDSATPRTVTNSINVTADTTLGTGVSSGALTLSGPLNFGGVARGLNHDNNVSLTGPASNGGITKSGTGTLTVGNAGTVLSDTTTVNAGQVTLTNGTFTGTLNIAPQITQVGVVEIGGGANITNTAQNNVAATGANTVGVIKQTGGNFVQTGTIAFGGVDNSVSAAYLMSGGFASFGGDTQLGRNGAVGLISQTGGAMQSLSFFTIARDGSLGVYDLSGGTHLRPITAANAFYLGNRSAASVAQAQVTIRSSGVLDIEDNNGLWFDRSAARTNQLIGMVNIVNGGTLISRVGLQWGNSNALSIGYVNFNNGTLSASGSEANFWSGWTAGYVYAGGATIDSQANTIGIGQGLLAPSASGVASITGFSGSGYLSPPVVIISGDGTGATAVAQIDGSGNLTGIIVTCPGVNYTSASVSLNGGGGTGSGGTANLAANSTAGGLTKLGAGVLNLNGTNTYVGTTLVTQGTLGGTGIIAGPVSVASGASLAPGASIGTLSINNDLTLAGGSSVAVEVNKDDLTTDLVTGLNNVTYAGSLVVTNLGTNAFAGGETFQLFSAAGTKSGNFTNITILPATGATGTFNPTNGILSINLTPVVPTPTNITYTVSGSQLVLNWPDGQGWQLQSQTNNLNVGLTTNWVTVPGAVPPFTNTIVPGNPSVFYRLKY